MSSQHDRITKAILEALPRIQPAKMDSIMRALQSAHLNEGKSLATVSRRVYELRRSGEIEQRGVGPQARYVMPGFGATSTTVDERSQQLAEGRRRSGHLAPVVEVVEVVDEQPAEVVDEQPAEVVEVVGSDTPRPVEADLADIGPAYVFTPKNTPTIPAVDPGIAHPAKAIEIVLSSTAQDIGTQVALMIERAMGERIAQFERQLAEKDRTIATLRADLAAAEQLANEAGQQYTELRDSLTASASVVVTQFERLLKKPAAPITRSVRA